MFEDIIKKQKPKISPCIIVYGQLCSKWDDGKCKYYRTKIEDTKEERKIYIWCEKCLKI